MTCRECNDTGFVNMGPTERGGVPVFELCECQPPQAPEHHDNPDDLMDAAIRAPWVIRNCKCAPLSDGCEMCDGAGWYYFNPETGAHVSDMMRDAFDRHG